MKVDAKVFKNSITTKVVPVLLCCIALCSFIHHSVAANIDLSIGRFVLFMDERITFDGVKMILHPEGFRSFIGAVIGGDQRYGRSLWNLMAAFSFFPALVWGDQGQIIAGRMLQVLLIVSACFVFTFGILRNWYLRLVLVIVMLAMPYSDYYMSMPKPEPLQLLLLAIFCFYYFRYKLKFGWYWIFAGLAFGTKISTLPALIVYGLFALVVNVNYMPDAHLGRSIKVALLSFFIGLAIAVPILLSPVLLGAGGYYLFGRLKNGLRLSVMSQGLFISFGLVAIYFISWKVIEVWVGSTFLNTKHGADQVSVNAVSWIKYFFETWLVVPELVGISCFVVAILFISLSGIFLLRTKAVSHNKIAALSVALSGIALNLAIFFGVQRLWGFYLYPGTILLVAGLVLMIDASFHEQSENCASQFKKTLRFLGYVVALLVFFVATFSWTPHTISRLEELARRTISMDYIQQYSSYQEVLKFLDNQKNIVNKSLRVMLTPSLFPPESGAYYQIVEFWGPFIQWNESPDVIIFGSVNTPRGMPTPQDSPSYSSFLLERQGYAMHVAESGSECKARPCFERKLLLPNGGEILVLKK
ncbi:MAG: hypothetical protein HY847_12625 [Betaproteobacteria bacterium]|nr:hypothetical protein [Betaproteobacteria bacterium]